VTVTLLAQFLLGGIFGLFVAVIFNRLKLLTFSGSVATFLLAVIIFGIGGLAWAVPIVTFFVTSSLLSRLGAVRKREFREMFEKPGARDWGQVAANGGAAGLLALLAGLFPDHDFYLLYLAALAAATADTWSTEIGVLSKGRVVSIVTFHPVPAGTSGGVSAFGTLGGVLGSVVLALSGYYWYREVTLAVIVIAGGIVGSVIDSMIGATLQGRFRCASCARETERSIHCGVVAEHVGGIRWIGNDVVNVACTVAGVLAAWGIMLWM
jgi:uncharacterized protein (TIGR00297 family)